MLLHVRGAARRVAQQPHVAELVDLVGPDGSAPNVAHQPVDVGLRPPTKATPAPAKRHLRRGAEDERPVGVARLGREAENVDGAAAARR